MHLEEVPIGTSPKEKTPCENCGGSRNRPIKLVISDGKEISMCRNCWKNLRARLKGIL